MSVEEGFLSDIIAHPDDDAPRLVYADWLEERGGKGDAERAELIRAQCRLAGGVSEKAVKARLEQRVKELLDAWGKVWFKPFRKVITRYEYRRGFIERATLQTKVFLAEAARLLTITPLRVVKLRDPKEHAEALAGCALLGRLEGLSVNYGKLGTARAEVLLASPHLGNLRLLDLGNNNIGLAGLRALLRAAPRLSALRRLALDDDNIRDVGAAELAAHPLLAQLTVLNLEANELTGEATRALARSPHVSRLRRLQLERNREITPADLRQLVSSPALAGLRKLYYTPITDAVRAALRKAGPPGLVVDAASWPQSLEDGPEDDA